MSALRRYAWAVGLVGLALVASFVLRLVLLGELDGKGTAIALLAAATLFAYAWLDGDGPGVRLGRALVLALGGLGAVGAYVGVRSVDTAFDMTTPRRFTLSEHGRAVVAGLQADVEVIGFFRYGSAGARRFDDMASQLAGPRLTVQLTDARRDPLLAQRLEMPPDQDGVVVRAGDRVERLFERLDEAAILNAVSRVAAGREHVVCWSVGHGEADPDDDRDPRALSVAVMALEGQAAQVQEISLLQGPPPASCEALVVAGPGGDLVPAEVDALVTWVGGGGRALLLVEPDVAPTYAAGLARLGVDARPGVVVDPDPRRRLGQVDVPVVSVLRRELWRPNPIAEGLGGAVVLGVARAVQPIDDVAGLRVHGLLFSSAAAWSELDEDGAAGPGEPVGELGLVVSVEVDDPAALGVVDGRPGGRAVIIGDASFAANELVSYGSNQELFLASLTWLLGEEELLVDRPDPTAAALEMTDQERGWLMLLSLVVGPLVPLVIGAQRWWARRRG
jgi:hypothetical protein